MRKSVLKQFSSLVGSNTPKNIGFIGLGMMGGPMALNLIKNGINVFGYDIYKPRLDELAKQGVKA